MYSEHICYFAHGGVPCTRPVAHSICRAFTVDGIPVEKGENWMCEECFQARVEFAREDGHDWAVSV
jgi:hypothetical protein